MSFTFECIPKYIVIAMQTLAYVSNVLIKPLAHIVISYIGSLDMSAKNAAYAGFYELCMHPHNPNNALGKACQGGHMAIVELMIRRGANDWNDGLWGACRYGHISIVELMIGRGANDWNYGLYGA